MMSKKITISTFFLTISEPLREGEIKSTSSPPRALTQLESSKSYESIQQQIPALVPINDNQKSLYKIPSNPFATAKTVSVTNLNHLKPVLRLKQVANGTVSKKRFFSINLLVNEFDNSAIIIMQTFL